MNEPGIWAKAAAEDFAATQKELADGEVLIVEMIAKIEALEKELAACELGFPPTRVRKSL